MRGLPFHDPDQIVHLNAQHDAANGNGAGVSYPDFEDLARAGEVLLGPGGYQRRQLQRHRQRASARAHAGRRRCTRERVQPARPAAAARPRLRGRTKTRRERSRSSSSDYGTWKIALRQRLRRRRPVININDVPATVDRRHARGHEVPEQCRPVAAAGRRSTSSRAAACRGMNVFGRLRAGRDARTRRRRN